MFNCCTCSFFSLCVLLFYGIKSQVIGLNVLSFFLSIKFVKFGWRRLKVAEKKFVQYGAYLKGQDMCDLIAGAEAKIPANAPENSEPRRKWKIKCGKALFALRTSIGKELIDHVRDTKQPSVEDFEILLSNKEALAKQMAKRLELDATLFSRDKNKKKNTSFESRNNEKESNGEKATSGNFDNNKCYICGKIEHIKKYRRVKLSKANIASENDGNEKLKWKQCFTIDVTKQRNNDVVPVQALYNNDSCKQEWILVSVDNSTYPIANEGVLKIDVGDTGAVKLNDVFHAPGLNRNLVSVSQITGFGKYILLGPNDVKILDNMKNISVDVVLTSEKKGSLFVMAVGEVYVKKTSQINSASIWHARLGTLGYQLLRQIYSKKLVDGLPALQNIHGDVVCQDAFSRYTWVKFLKEKSEALSKFAEFKTAVEKDFGVKVKCMRSDNGSKYMSHALFKYCDKNAFPGCTIRISLKSFELKLFNARVIKPAIKKPFLMVIKRTLSSFLRETCRDQIMKEAQIQMILNDKLKEVLDEPVSYEESKGHPKWNATMQEEIDALNKNQTWKLVSTPENCKLITCKWVYHLKKNSNGVVDKYKAQLVARVSKKFTSFDATRRMLSYVKGSLDHGLMYRRHEKFVLNGYTDTDWAGDANDRHSTSGYCFNTGSAMVSWYSKMQSVVTLSSTEAEYVAATMAAQECMYLKILIGEMMCKVDYAIQIRCDNESSVKLASNISWSDEARRGSSPLHSRESVGARSCSERNSYKWVSRGHIYKGLDKA
ncbi:hypothetical protein KY284_011000 [Solanum tuberosum]|nr:hypothetical protein KY284_011000 [Solanum tuberosum]